MSIVVVDNYDSFTFILLHLAQAAFGAQVRVVKNDEPWDRVAGASAVIISPGPGRPDRVADFGISGRVIRELNVPILGVCLGHQGICQAFGGDIVHAPVPMHGRTSQVFHDESGLFAGIPNPFRAVRYHSLMCAQPLPAELRETAWTEDGVNMAVEHRTRPVWGVQFHPESICTEYGERLMRNFARLATQRAMWVRQFAMQCDAEQLFERAFSDRPYAFWLDSSSGGRFSFLGGYTEGENETIRYRVGENGEDLFAELNVRLGDSAVRGPELPFEFRGGFVGYFGYELKALCGGSSAHRSNHPDAYLMAVDRFIAIDHETDLGYLVYIGEQDAGKSWFDCIQARPAQSPEFLPAQPRDAYIGNIRKAIEAIRDGESYEVCLTNRLKAKTDADPFQFYRALRRQNPSPYSAFFKFPELSIACSSPERFLKISAAGEVESKPIKGTAPRSDCPEEDQRLKDQLQTSEKNRAENLMIVDLLRNDLARVCEAGSVHVPSLMEVESYATVHQLVSTIRGRPRPDCTAVDCLRAAFPGGSMTGAPKIRTMQILDALETEARGVYSGALGYLSYNGAADLNIVIRTAVFSGGEVTIGTGGAITALSDPEEEWNEILLKAQALIAAFSGLT